VRQLQRILRRHSRPHHFPLQRNPIPPSCCRSLPTKVVHTPMSYVIIAASGYRASFHAALTHPCYLCGPLATVYGSDSVTRYFATIPCQKEGLCQRQEWMACISTCNRVSLCAGISTPTTGQSYTLGDAQPAASAGISQSALDV
jgi:hypothetical protein